MMKLPCLRCHCGRKLRNCGLCKCSKLKVVLLLSLGSLLFCLSFQLENQALSSSETAGEQMRRELDSNHRSHDSVKKEGDENGKGLSEESKQGLTAPARIIGNGRSPKQVDEELLKQQKKQEGHPGGTPSKNFTKQSEDAAHLSSLPSLSGPNSLQILQDILLKANKAQTIRNIQQFSPLTDDTLVLVVQVHKRDQYLKQLLESLKAARGIENVLLVISHDYYYDDMNALIQTVDFCPVLQIFYPYSLQAMPDTFPGVSENDCPRDISKEKAIAAQCTNALHPDSYGHYREAIVTAIKHHWWWKVNMVFDNLHVTRNFDGFVLFLEEDHFVAPDFLEVAKQLIAMKKERCKECEFINLGMYNKVKTLNNRVSVGVWNAGKNNMGFGMNRESWNRIRNCSEHFCTYDDYNWDWSLNQLGSACPLIKRDLKVLVIKTPRVFHIGTCGTHHHRSCNEVNQANAVRDLLRKQASNLFPSNLGFDTGIYPPPTRKKIKPYGGWGDIRDHQLCTRFTEKNSLIDYSNLPT